MKKFLFNKLFCLFILPAAMLVSFTIPFDRVNFSGDWKLDESKSELGEFGGRVARSMKVEQKEDVISIARTTPGFNGGEAVTTTASLTYDGKITESEGFGGSKRKSSAAWSADGSALTLNSTIVFDRDGQTMEFKSTETWTMKDGMLSVVTHSNSPRGESTTKAIYKK